MRWPSIDSDPSWVLVEEGCSDSSFLPLNTHRAETIQINPKQPSSKLRPLFTSHSPYPYEGTIVSASPYASNRHFPETFHQISHSSLTTKDRRPYSRSPLRPLTALGANREKTINESLNPCNRHFPETFHRASPSPLKTNVRRSSSRSPLRPLTVFGANREKTINESLNPSNRHFPDTCHKLSIDSPKKMTHNPKLHTGKLVPLFLGDTTPAIDGLALSVRSYHSLPHQSTLALQQNDATEKKSLNLSQTQHTLFTHALQEAAFTVHANRQKTLTGNVNQ